MNASSTTRACPKCSSAVAATSQFCPTCGTAVSGIFSGSGTPLAGTAVVPSGAVDTVLPLLQDATLGHYDIYGQLGRGGMAAVYLALDLRLNRKVAIKTMLPELVSHDGMVDRFRREATTSASLSHPHIIQIFAVEETPALVFFVMKYIEGRSLESIIIERGQLDVDLTRTVMSQAGSALNFAHRKKVIHRDVKPANIMIEEDGWAIVTDFGIAKVQEAQNLTATGTAIGTPHYMSPEQFHNKAVTGASDQYSLGIVAYEMLTGRKPFDGATYAEIITQHLFEPPPDLREFRSDVPDAVSAAIARMLSKNAEERFPDLDAAVTALGVPSRTQGEVVKTQMIDLAKSGAEKRMRMSVPLSPVPLARRKPPEKTVVEGQPTVVAKSSKTGLWIGVAAAVLLLAVGGGGAYYFTVLRGQGAQGMTAGAGAGARAAPTTVQTPVIQQPPAAATVAIATPEAPPPSAPSKEQTQPAKSPKEIARARSDSLKAKAARTAAASKPTETVVQAAKDTPKLGTTAPAASAPNLAAQVAAATNQEAPKVTKVSGSVKIGTVTDNAFFYVNSVNVGPIAGLSTRAVTTGSSGSIKIRIVADKCAPWDSTFTISEGQTVTVGRRNLACTP
ncbi:hypothetical protein BH09GEM1_BH09GEM1_39650 [soil metagenome]